MHVFLFLHQYTVTLSPGYLVLDEDITERTVLVCLNTSDLKQEFLYTLVSIDHDATAPGL